MDTCSVLGDTVSQTIVLSFARINVIYLPELGGQLPPLTPRLIRLWHRDMLEKRLVIVLILKKKLIEKKGQHGAGRGSMAQRNEGMAPRHAKNA